MDKNQYLSDKEVASFRNWLAQCIQGQPVHFNVGPHHYLSLPAAKAAYAWPLKAQTGLPNPHNGHPYIHPAVQPLTAHANLAANTVVLGQLQHALKAASKGGQTLHLAGAVAGIFHWGGVYTTTPHGGNKPWLARNYANLCSILNQFADDHARGTDSSTVAGLRFNAGMTKVYALLLDDFIIYDSRVAASLTWLTLNWWTTVKKSSPAELPALLRFGTLPPNGSARSHRNAAPGVFRGITRPDVHYMWNVRANWLLSDAFKCAGQGINFSTLREVEAALFQMGDRVI